MDEKRLLQLVELIYDAATDPTRWPVFLARTGELLRSECGSLLVHDFESMTGSIAVPFGTDEAALRQYEEYYCKTNTWIQHGGASLPLGEAVIGEERLCSARDLLRSEYYEDYLRPLGDLRHLLASAFLREDAWMSYFCFVRSGRQGASKPEERELMQALIPHLRRAVQVHRRLLTAELMGRHAGQALQQLELGVLFVGERGQVLLANRAAEAMLAECDGLSAGVGGLMAARAAETSALRALVAGAAATSQGRGLHPGGSLALARPSGRRALSVLVAPLAAGRYLLGPAAPVVAVFVVDPEKGALPPEALLRQLYGLTRAEARLGVLLLEGGTLKEAAEALGTTLHTARTHVKSIFRKTGVRGQAELVRLLLRSYPPLRSEGAASAGTAGPQPPRTDRGELP